MTAIMDRTRALQYVKNLIESIGDDPSREGLADTPRRVVDSWAELFAGYKTTEEDLRSLLSRSFGEVDGYDQMILCRDVPFVSFCEHHLLPFSGVVHLGYLPTKKVVGLSKIPRLIQAISRRLQIQERMTQQIANIFNEVVHPLGVGVLVVATHSCVSCRGIRAVGSDMVTSALIGAFREDPQCRSEFLSLVKDT